MRRKREITTGVLCVVACVLGCAQPEPPSENDRAAPKPSDATPAPPRANSPEQRALSKEDLEKIAEASESTDLTGNVANTDPAPKQERDCEEAHLVVKAIALTPRKEAVIYHRCRVYVVRPGDEVDGIRIIDISESGLKTKRTSRAKKKKTQKKR